MAKPSKKLRKRDFFFAVNVYSEVTQKRIPGIWAQTHEFVDGQMLDTKSACEMALFMIYHAKDSFDDDEQYAYDIFAQAKGVLMAHGIVVSMDDMPEIPIVPKSTKPS